MLAHTGKIEFFSVVVNKLVLTHSVRMQLSGNAWRFLILKIPLVGANHLLITKKVLYEFYYRVTQCELKK